jgi:hypothetical protein
LPQENDIHIGAQIAVSLATRSIVTRVETKIFVLEIFSKNLFRFSRSLRKVAKIFYSECRSGKRKLSLNRKFRENFRETENFREK